jgi:hypothetical protein
MLRACLTQVVLASAALVLLAAPAQADTTVTVDFDGYGTGTQITTQYAGVTFEQAINAGFSYGTPADGVVAPGACALPLVTAPSHATHSGIQAGALNCGTEFAPAGAFAALSNLADQVSVYVGSDIFTGDTYELDAYDASRHLVGSTVGSGTTLGAENLLSVSTSSASIAYVAVYRSAIGDTGIIIDDLSAHIPAGAQSYVGLTTGNPVPQVAQGGTISTTLTVQRINGATGPATISVSGLPSGVTPSLSPNPVSLPASTSMLTLTAGTSAPVGSYPISISVSAPSATSQPPLALTLDVVPPLTLIPEAQARDVLPCTVTRTTVTADLGPGISGPIDFTATPGAGASGLQVGLTQSHVTPVNGVATTELDVQELGGGPSPAVPITVRALTPVPQLASTTVTVHPLGPEVDSIDAIRTVNGTPVAGLQAFAPQALGPGSPVEITGHGFCQTATIQFGNPFATTTASVQPETDAHGNPYQYIRTTVPRLATTGPVTVEAGSPLATGSSSASLAVDSFRNVDGYAFHNFNPSVDYSNLTDGFGADQTYLSFDPCAAFTLGVAHCPVSTGIPDPAAAIQFAFWQPKLDEGACFGFSLSSQRFVRGIEKVTDYARHADSVYGIDAPTDSNSPIERHILAAHVQQMSLQFENAWLGKDAAQQITAPDTVRSDVRQEIVSELAAGKDPLVTLQGSVGGHVVVAYDLQDAGPGEYYIDVYDSNEPFDPAENTSDGTFHKSQFEASRIHVSPDNTWTLTSTADANGADNGGVQSIVVLDPGVVPLHPNLLSAGGLSALFGSATATSRVTQLSDGAGHVLMTPSGGANHDAHTRLDAASYAALVGSRPHQSPVILVSPRVGHLEETISGVGSGSDAHALVQPGLIAQVTSHVAHGVSEQLGFTRSTHEVSFTTTAHASPLDLSLEAGSGHAFHTAGISTTSFAGAGDTLALDASGLRFDHHGGATTFRVMLSSVQKGAAPTTFMSARVSVGAGQSVRLTGIRWTHLGAVQATIGARHVVLVNTLHVASPGAITRLRIAHGRKGKVLLSVGARLVRQPATASAMLTWIVRLGHRVVATHVAHLATGRRQATRTWAFQGRRGMHYRLTAGLVVISPNGLAESTAHIARTLAFTGR